MKKYYADITFFDEKGNDIDVAGDSCLGIFDSYEEAKDHIDLAISTEEHETKHNPMKRIYHKAVSAYAQIFEGDDKEGEIAWENVNDDENIKIVYQETIPVNEENEEETEYEDDWDLEE